jgi:hypothetical protein
MKRLIPILGCSLLAALPAGSDAQERSCEAVSYEQVIEKQNRINRYLHRSVVPKMMSCWETLSGKGSISVAFNFSRDAGKWTAGDSKLLASTLVKGQDQVALHCLQQAVRDTSFPATDADGKAKEMLVNWGFPVPWPTSAEEIVGLAIDTGGGGGGCGGKESPPPACYDCSIPVGQPSSCVKVCVGYRDCTNHSDGKGCNLGPISPRCVTGSPFGNIGGVVIY